MNSATYKRPFKPVSSLASIDGRYNTTGGTYNGQAQTDGGSGGPMSTTSNVLNLGECPTSESCACSGSNNNSERRQGAKGTTEGDRDTGERVQLELDTSGVGANRDSSSGRSLGRPIRWNLFLRWPGPPSERGALGKLVAGPDSAGPPKQSAPVASGRPASAAQRGEPMQTQL